MGALSSVSLWRLSSSKRTTSDPTWPKELPLYWQNKYTGLRIRFPAQRQHQYKALLASIVSVIPQWQPVPVSALGNLEVIDSTDRFAGYPQIYVELIEDGAAACEVVHLVKT